MSAAPKRMAVVGAGIAGMAAAYEAVRHPDWNVTLFDAASRLGGTVETVHEHGFTMECGPDSWVSDRPAVRELAEELGLAGELIHSNDKLRRNYLVRGRELVPMPEGMRMVVPTRWAPILESPLFSWQARLAYLREPRRADEFKAAALSRSEDEDESVRAFVTRHFGEEATETIAGPLLAGVFGGNIDTLSAGAVLAPFVRLEREHGSLIAPTMQQVEEQRSTGQSPLPVFTTLRSGLGTLVEALATALPPGCVRLSTPVSKVRRSEDGGWSLTAARQEQESFDGVILATPAHVTRQLLKSVDSEAAELLTTEASSAIVVALCFDRAASLCLRIPRGFGFLVPPELALGETPELLAGTFMHQKFRHRAPEGAVFLRGFFGGRAAPAIMDREDKEIVEMAHARFSRVLGLLPSATCSVVRRWPQSLPQYSVGHPQRMRALEQRLEALPGLALTGNAYRGVGLPAVVHHARAAAKVLLQKLSRSGLHESGAQ